MLNVTLHCLFAQEVYNWEQSSDISQRKPVRRHKTPKDEINSSDNIYILLALYSLQEKDLWLTYLFFPDEKQQLKMGLKPQEN